MIRTIAAATTLTLTLSWAFAGAVFMFALIAAYRSASQERLEPVATVAETAPASPYAYATWVKLGDLVPMEAGAVDVCVWLIVVDGEVLLRPDPQRVTLNHLPIGGSRRRRDRARPGGN